MQSNANSKVALIKSKDSEDGYSNKKDEKRESKPNMQDASDNLEEENFQQKAKIEDQMNNENLEQLQKIFEEADEDNGGGLDIEEFGQAMKMAFGSMNELDDKQLSIMFMKVDTNCDGTVDWEEFCSYMLLENQQKDSMSRDYIDLPFPNPAREIPSPHHDSLARIAYFPSLGVSKRTNTDEEMEEVENGNGRYISCSKDGVFVFWGLDLQIQRTVNLTESHGNKSKQIWVTDVVVLANVKKVAISSTERDVSFYDCSANNFEKQFVIAGLDHCVLCMDYWFNPRNLNHSVLVLGDSGGGVSCITFTQASVGLFDVSIGKQNNMSTSTVRRIPFLELVNGRHPNVSAVSFNGLHDDWVRKVKYIPSLQCFLSCANTSQTSLFLGDLHSKKMKSYFKIRKGIYSFDYEKENNVIVTGGLDRYVRLWNPYVTSKATSVLKGHNSSVIHIIAQGDQIISFSKDKVVKIWDARDHLCIQTIPSRLTDISSHPTTTVLYNRKMQTLLLGSNMLAVLEKKARFETTSTEEDPTSHPKPLCGALYNDLFNQVVSACHGSVVNVWHVDTGEKAIMFTNAHDGHEITAMSFDPTKRRLLTGSRDGSIKIWNFNNGACLRELKATDDSEVTGIICPKQRIVTVGWNHKITVYRDVRGAEDDPPKSWNSIHKDDILAVEVNNNGCMATASYDGQVTCWNIETGHLYCQLNVNKVLKSRAQSHANNFAQSPANNLALKEDLNSRRSSRRGTTADLLPGDINKHLSVDKILFLRYRVATRDTATLLVSVEGIVQAWSISGGLLGQFDATGGAEDESILAMSSDEQNHVLFTGDNQGFIKIWDISAYCMKGSQRTSTSTSRCTSPLDAFERQKKGGAMANMFRKPTTTGISNNTSRSNSMGSAKISETGLNTMTSPPSCLTSYRAHCSSIVTLDYVNSMELVVSASTDCCVRLFTLNGKYIGTFGQKQPWDSLENPINLKKPRRIPNDLQRVASTQSLKVLNGAAPKWKLAKNIFHIIHLGRRLTTKTTSKSDEENAEEEIDDETAELSRPQVLDISLTNILGKNYKAKQRHKIPPNVKPKIKNLQCVAFSSLPFIELDPIVEPKMPQVLAQVLAARYQHRSISPHERGRFNRKNGGSPMRQAIKSLLPALALRK